MKKTKIILIAGLLMIAPFTFTRAQSFHADSAPVLASKLQPGQVKSVLDMQNKAGFNAMKDVSARFTSTSDVKWFVANNAIFATVINDGIKNSVLYDKRGHWLRTIKNYDESKMPADIRETVKRSKYFDDSITQVFEIQEGTMLVYLVSLEDKKTLNQVVVYDGEVSRFKTFSKQ